MKSSRKLSSLIKNISGRINTKEIEKAVEKLSGLLEKEGKRVRVKRVGKLTLERLGVCLLMSGRRMRTVDRGVADREIESGIRKAKAVLKRDSTARYAVGIPDTFPGGRSPPCFSLVQLFHRKGTKLAICHLRSADIAELSLDLTKIASELSGYGIFIVIGSLHKYLE